MKKILLPALLLALFSYIRSNAQAPFNTLDSVDINKIHIPIQVHGDMFWSNYLDYYNGYGTGIGNLSNSAFFSGAIWMSGYDASNVLHLAAQTYRSNNIDYWPGPLYSGGPLSFSASQDWAKIWKVNRTDIDSFLSLPVHTRSNTPAAILTWPAKGNVDAQGNGGVALTITTDMAPFVDLNGNGIYEPLLGEYPDVTGDQALWWVFNDNGPVHSLTNGRPLGVEVHSMAYAYKRGTLIDNVVYLDHTIVNRSLNDYHGFRFGLWDKMNISLWGGNYYGNTVAGYFPEYFIGFDSSRRLGIKYYGVNDGGAGAGHPINSYGPAPPVIAVTMIVLPGDTGTNYVPAGSFDYYNKDSSIVGIPAIDTEFDNVMHAKLRSGAHFTNDYLGPGIQSKGYGSGPECNYVYTGDPSDRSQWSECSCNNNPWERHFVFSSNDFDLLSGSSQHIVMAVAATDSGDGGCPRASFTKIKAVSDTAWNIYHNPLPSLRSLAHGNTNTIYTYPNPSNDKYCIEDRSQNIAAATVTVHNYTGNKVDVPVNKNGQTIELDISQLPTGLYILQYQNGNFIRTTKFIKE